jgi:hypothetical protein
MRNRGLHQSGGADSTNVQAAGDVHIHHDHLSVTEIRDLVSDAIRANMFNMRAEAERVANERIEAFSARYANRVALEGPEVLAATQDPDVQFTITQAGIGYARTGDEALSEVLVDLLADRARAAGRSLLAVVINDAVGIAPRLTQGEIAALSLHWRLNDAIPSHVVDLQTFEDYVRDEIAPLVGALPRGEGSYLHLQSLGCVSIQFSQYAWAHPWVNNYSGVLNKGFERDWVPEVVRGWFGDNDPFVPALRNPEYVQVAATRASVIDEWTDMYRGPVLTELKRLHLLYTMDADEIAATLTEIDPRMADLPGLWDSTALGAMALTAVGVAIAHADFRRSTGDPSPLSRWINDDPTP